MQVLTRSRIAGRIRCLAALDYVEPVIPFSCLFPHMSQNLCHALCRPGKLLLLSGLFLGGCDSADPPTAPTADAADGLSYTVLTGAESRSALTSGFGCRGSVWLPKRGEYSPVALKLNLPEQIVAAAKGATYTPRFIIRENGRPGSRALLGVECSLPDVQDPTVEKAHKSVARFLAKELNKLQQAADVAARTDMGHNGSLSGASGFGTQFSLQAPQFSLQTQESCGWELIDSYQNEDGSWTYVYQYKCSGGGGDGGGGNDCGWDGSGCGGGGGDTCDPTMVIGRCEGDTVGTPPGSGTVVWEEDAELGPEHFETVGLCKKPGGRGVRICLESFISAPLYGAGDGRDPMSAGGTYKTSIRFSIDPATGYISGSRRDIGKTFGLVPGVGDLKLERAQSDGRGGWMVWMVGSARQVLAPWLGDINFDVRVHIDQYGTVRTAGGSHDGFPSFELWSYPEYGGSPTLVYHRAETTPSDLYGCCGVAIPNNTP